MSQENITRLYKYRAINKHTLEGLRNNKLWISQPNSFNDPFDCNTDNYDPDKIDFGTIGILNRSGLNHIDFNEPSNRRSFNKLRHAKFVEKANEFGVLCLATNCESTLMWSHYSDSHRGFCMEFERTGNCELDDLEIPRPVSYSRSCPNIDLDKSWDLSGIDPFRLELCKLVLAKAEEWQYEREWRCIYRHGNRLVDYPGKLKSIIWGMRTSEEDKIAIRDILKNSAVIFRRSKRSQGEFRIAIEPEQV